MPNILLIEDMQGVRESLDVILSLAGHNVDQASNGREGLEKIASGSYDLIITDILMPEIDGSEVILDVKKRPDNPPILAISAGGNGVSADQALTLAAQKADGILEKPFSKEDLLKAINDLTQA